MAPANLYRVSIVMESVSPEGEDQPTGGDRSIVARSECVTCMRRAHAQVFFAQACDAVSVFCDPDAY